MIPTPGTLFQRAVREPLRHSPAGLPRRAFPEGVSNTRSNQLELLFKKYCREAISSIFRQKEFRISRPEPRF